MKINKIVLALLLITVLFISGCNSVSDFFSDVLSNKPYISQLKADKTFYTPSDKEIKILVKIKNPTNSDYSPVKLGVNYPNGTIPVDQQLKENKPIELVSIKSNEEKSYFVVFNIDKEITKNTLEFKFAIYNYANYEFDVDPIIVEFSPNPSTIRWVKKYK